MADPFVAEIRIFPFNFAPKGWAFCNGQIMAIAQNTALFSLLGTTYGGDGKSTFGLPDLQARVAVNAGEGPGLSLYDIGQLGGEAEHTLIEVEVPAHNHSVPVANAAATVPVPDGNRLGAPTGATPYGDMPPNPVGMAAEALAVSGGGQPHNNLMPSLVLSFCIALQGVYPPRS